MKARAAALALILAACSGPPPPVIAPPPPGNQPRISAQAICYEVWHDLDPPFGDGHPYNVVYWRWTTVDGPSHVQVQDVTHTTVARDFVIPLGGGTFWQRFNQGDIGRIMWESSPGGWTPVALFPGNGALPALCTWTAPPV